MSLTSKYKIRKTQNPASSAAQGNRNCDKFNFIQPLFASHYMRYLCTNHDHGVLHIYEFTFIALQTHRTFPVIAPIPTISVFSAPPVPTATHHFGCCAPPLPTSAQQGRVVGRKRDEPFPTTLHHSFKRSHLIYAPQDLCFILWTCMGFV